MSYSVTIGYGILNLLQFHADAEKGLGPVVASLSLGSTSHMYFRRSKHDLTDDDVPKGYGILTMVLKHVSHASSFCSSSHIDQLLGRYHGHARGQDTGILRTHSRTYGLSDGRHRAGYFDDTS